MHVSTIARRYGRSLARVAIENRKEKTVGGELLGIWELLREDAHLRVVLESPAATKERQRKVVEVLAEAARLTDYTKNLLLLLVEARRFALFREVYEAYRVEVDAYHGVVEVEVTTAHPLDDEQREALRGTIQRHLVGGKEVRLDLRVDPRLVAGAVAKIGSVVHDGSLVHQLDELRQQLVSE